ncbi:MAG: hypothetical protein RR295_10060 [Oscillospiraceae bacterium]
MFNVLKRELAELSEKRNRRSKIESMLGSLCSEERDLSQKEYTLRISLSKENADVERLEKTTATSVFYSILGKKDERLEREQQEAYAAKLKYDAAVRQMDDCRTRIEALEQERRTLSDCERRYNQVFSEMETLLRDNPRYAQKLCALERQLGETNSQLREVAEAISAGNACMDQISRIESSLDSAEGWGAWDVFGGGLVADLAKHSHLDEAQSGAEYLQTLLSRFRTELADVKISASMGQVNVDGFLRFADYFFDGLIADWSVLSHIHDSQQSVTQVKGQLSSALSKLSSIKSALAAQKTKLEQEIEALVHSAS